MRYILTGAIMFGIGLAGVAYCVNHVMEMPFWSMGAFTFLYIIGFALAVGRIEFNSQSWRKWNA